MNDESKSDSEFGKFNGNIRFLQKADMPFLRPILETWIRDSETGELIESEVEDSLRFMEESLTGENNSRTYFVAEESIGNRVIGIMGMALPEKKRGFARTNNPVEIVNAFVSERYRKRGVGSALVRRIEEEARHRGFTEILVSSGPRYKDSGWRFYDKHFSRVAMVKKYYNSGTDAVIWHKVL